MSCYRVAETAFALETVYARTPRMLAAYRTEEPPELTVRTTEAEIAAEGAKLEEAHSPAYVESLLVYRKLCDYLLGKDVLLFHGDADAAVPMRYSQRAAELFPSCELRVIPGGRHGFEGDQYWQVVGQAADWLRAHIG